MRDREPIRMADSPIEFEQTPVNAREFVVKAVTDVGGRVAHWSVGPATDIDRNLFLKEPWQALAQVPVLDPNLRFTPEELKNPTDETLSLAVPLFLAKSKQVEQEITLSPKERRVLEKNEKSVLSLLGPKGRNTVAALAMLTAACSSAITPPLPEPTPTEAPVADSTEIAPSPTYEANEVAVSQRYITGDELMTLVAQTDDPTTEQNEAEIDRVGIESAFSDYQSALALEHPNATFERWGIESAMLDGGPILSPFFETVGPDGKSLDIAILIGLEAGGFKYIRLESLEVTGPDGKNYLTLSQTISAETGEEISPEPMFWVPYSRAEWDALTPEAQAAVRPLFNGLGGIIPEAQPLDGGKVAAIRAVLTPVAPEPGPTPTEVPPPYEIVDGYREEVREEILGVPVSVDIITDTSLQDRHPANNPVEKLFLNTERFPNASKDVSEATMRAIWYAWKDDAPEERESIIFEDYMQMVKEYIDGERQLSDVEYQVWANDLQTAVFKTEVFSFDPTQPIKTVYLDELATKNISYVSPRNRSGIQRNSDGNLEIWLAYPKDRFSFWATILYVQSLNRLTWPSEYQHAKPKRIDGSEAFYDPSKYHSDVHNKLIRITTSSGGGAISIEPNDWDNWD